MSLRKHNRSSTANSLQRPKFCGPSSGENALGEADREEGLAHDRGAGQTSSPGAADARDFQA